METRVMTKKLDKHEREIERSAGQYRNVNKRDLRRIESILGRVRKTRNINIRISEMVLAELKRRSAEEGIPYQTLISSVLHKFVTIQLMDEKAISRSIELLSAKRNRSVA